MQIKSIEDFESLSEAIDYFEELVIYCSNCNDSSVLLVMLEFKDELWNRIKKRLEDD